MSSQRPVSTREIARITGYSKATVANTLNGSNRVAPETAREIRAAAARLGYERNPMVGALMSAMRRSHGHTLRGVLAVTEIAEPDRPAHGPFHRELVRGCAGAAEELGFTLEAFQLEAGGLTPERLSGILKARGIRGLVLLPAWRAPDFSRFDWSAFAGVYTDYLSGRPAMPFVCCDHYRSMLDLLSRLRERGYRRPGLVMESGRDARLDFRPSAAVLAFQAAMPRGDAARPLLAREITRAGVGRWLDRERPDVVMSHHSDVLDWLTEAGLAVPGDIGFVGLNMAKAGRKCASLDLRPRLIGRCAVEILIAQIQRQVWRAPVLPANTTVQGEFVDGGTLRPAGAGRDVRPGASG